MSADSQVLLLDTDAEGQSRLRCPAVGKWKGVLSKGQLISAGQVLGYIEVLGKAIPMVVPPKVRGVVTSTHGVQKGSALQYGDTLVSWGTLSESGIVGDAETEAESQLQEGALVVTAISSGRYYSRPSPDKPEFVREGDEIELGQTVYLLEVMKTFSRVAYEGEGLPSRAKVLRVVPNDGDDLEPGQTVLELEAI